MSANFKRVWYVSCVECAKQATLIDGLEKKVRVKDILSIYYNWTFPKGEPHRPKHSRRNS